MLHGHDSLLEEVMQFYPKLEDFSAFGTTATSRASWVIAEKVFYQQGHQGSRWSDAQGHSFVNLPVLSGASFFVFLRTICWAIWMKSDALT
jgi:hypothetical protein